MVEGGKLVTSVYLNCCSTFLMTFPHSRHLKVPWRSSGRTSLVRVTTPLTDTNFPMSAVAKSLNLPKFYRGLETTAHIWTTISLTLKGDEISAEFSKMFVQHVIIPLQQREVKEGNIYVLVGVIIRDERGFLFHHKSLAGILQEWLQPKKAHIPKFKSINMFIPAHRAGSR